MPGNVKGLAGYLIRLRCSLAELPAWLEAFVATQPA